MSKMRWQGLQDVARSFTLSVLPVILMLATVTFADNVTRKIIARTAPSYPEMAKKMHLTGKVRVEVVIAPNGSVTNARLIGGSPVFEKSAVEAVKQWRFEPADRETKGVVVLEFEDH